MTGSILLLATLTAGAGSPAQCAPAFDFPQAPPAPYFQQMPTTLPAPDYSCAPHGYVMPLGCTPGAYPHGEMVMPPIYLPSDPAPFLGVQTNIVFPAETLDEKVEKQSKAVKDLCQDLGKLADNTNSALARHDKMLDQGSRKAANMQEQLDDVKSALNTLRVELAAANAKFKMTGPGLQEQISKLTRQIQKIAVVVDAQAQKFEKITPIHAQQIEDLMVTMKRLALEFEAAHEKHSKELVLLEKALDRAQAGNKGDLKAIKEALNHSAEIHERLYQSLNTKATQAQLASVVEQVNAIFKMMASQPLAGNPCPPAESESRTPQKAGEGLPKSDSKSSDAPKCENGNSPTLPPPQDMLPSVDTILQPATDTTTEKFLP